jgi:hypothetical protein
MAWRKKHNEREASEGSFREKKEVAQMNAGSCSIGVIDSQVTPFSPDFLWMASRRAVVLGRFTTGRRAFFMVQNQS